MELREEWPKPATPEIFDQIKISVRQLRFSSDNP